MFSSYEWCISLAHQTRYKQTASLKDDYSNWVVGFLLLKMGKTKKRGRGKHTIEGTSQLLCFVFFREKHGRGLENSSISQLLSLRRNMAAR
jgi:hypothetical protein